MFEKKKLISFNQRKRSLLLLFTLIFIGSICIFCLFQAFPSLQANSLDQNPVIPLSEFPPKGYVRIVRDTFGVPHVMALKEKDLYYGFGYAQAQDRLEQIITTYYTGKGRLSELIGEAGLDSDIMVRSFDLEPKAKKLAKRLPKRIKVIFRAFLDGINAYIKEHHEELPDWITGLKFEGLEDVCYVHYAHIIYDRIGSTNGDSGRPEGSNAFTISGSRTKNGKPLLVFDPHTQYSGFSVLYEAQISTPEYSIIGETTPISQYISQGFNGKIAWGGTANYPDVYDVYKFEIDPQDSDRYKNYDGWRTFKKLDTTIKIKTANGYRNEDRTILITHVGPVFLIADGYAYASRIAKFESFMPLEPALHTFEASTVEEYFEGFKKYPNQEDGNRIAADAAGNIGYLYFAYLPKRDPVLDWSQPVPGEDPRSEWMGYHSFEELPQVINPQSGWLQNANDDPWQVTENSGIDVNLPFRLTFPRITTRGQRLRELLSGDPNVTFNEALKYATDTNVLKARLWVPILINTFDDNADSLSLIGTDTEAAINLFRKWNYRADRSSKAMTVFFYWFDGMLRDIQNLETSDQITESMKLNQLTRLGEAATYVKEKLGRVDITWGEVQYYEHGGKKYPLDGYGGWFPVVRAIWSPPRDDGYLEAIGGSSFCMAIELSSNPRMKSSFPFGQSNDPNSPHYNDMSELFSRTKFKPVWYTWDQLKKHIESDVTLSTKK